jgi:hypothetical protein
MMLAIVTNAWRTSQMLVIRDKIRNKSFTQIRTKFNNYCVGIADFNYTLALALIASANNPNIRYGVIGLGARFHYHEDAASDDNDEGDALAVLGGNSDTLAARVAKVKWPKRYVLEKFSTDPTLRELRLTHNNVYTHRRDKLLQSTEDKRKVKFCVLCRNKQTAYGCMDCKVILCRISNDGTSSSKQCCFVRWHQKINLKTEKNKRSSSGSDKAMDGGAAAGDGVARAGDPSDEEGSDEQQRNVRQRTGDSSNNIARDTSATIV